MTLRRNPRFPDIPSIPDWMLQYKAVVAPTIPAPRERERVTKGLLDEPTAFEPCAQSYVRLANRNPDLV